MSKNLRGIAVILPIILVLIILGLAGYIVYSNIQSNTESSLPIPVSLKSKATVSPQVVFDPDHHFRIQIIDSVSGKGIKGVPINFLNNCPGPASNDNTCGGKYDVPSSGKTDEYGYLLIVKTEKTAPPGVLNFQLGKIPGYNTDIGTGSFYWEDGPRNEVVYKVVKTGDSSEDNNKEIAISAAESSSDFQSWSSFMDEVYGPTVDIREGLWRVYYQGTRENAGDWMITFYVDNSGEIVEVEEPLRKVLQ